MPIPRSLIEALLSRWSGPGGGGMSGMGGMGSGWLGRADNAFRGFTSNIGEGLSSGVQSLMSAIGGWGGPRMSQTGPMAGGYQFPPSGPPQPQNISMPGSGVAGGTAPWMQGMLPYTQPGWREGGRGRGSTGAVGWLLNRPGDEAGDAIGFMRRN